MKRNFRLIAMLLGMLVAPLALNSCSDDDDDDEQKVENTDKPGNNDQKPEEGDKPSEEVTETKVKDSYKVAADLMNVKWNDVVSIAKTGDDLISITLKATDMPKDDWSIQDAKLENVKLVKTAKGYELSNADESFAASMKMSAGAGAPLKEYSTADASAQLKVNSFSGSIEGDKFVLDLGLQAGRMPLTIPLTLTSAE